MYLCKEEEGSQYVNSQCFPECRLALQWGELLGVDAPRGCYRLELLAWPEVVALWEAVLGMVGEAWAGPG